ncbi:hypothetical protein ACFE04_015762 [Oxalis oulophora]
MLLVILPVVTLGYINDHLAPDHAPLYGWSYALTPAYEAVTKSYEDGPSGNTSKPGADEVDSREVNLLGVNVLFDSSELHLFDIDDVYEQVVCRCEWYCEWLRDTFSTSFYRQHCAEQGAN